MLGKVAGDERIVLRLAQERSDPLEGINEFEEARIGVAPADFLFGHGDAVASGQCADGCGLDGTFQMKVQLGLGQGSNPLREQGRRHPWKISAAIAADRRLPTP